MTDPASFHSLTSQLLTAGLDQSKYKVLFDNAPICIHEIDIHGRITCMNNEGLRMLGVEREADVCGAVYLDFVGNDEREKISDLFEQGLAGISNDFEFSTSTGNRRFASCFIPIFDQNQIVLKIMGITQDVTDARKAEQSIRTSEAKYRSLFDNANIGIAELDMEQTSQLYDELRKRGVSDLDSFLDANPEWVKQLTDTFIVRQFNNSLSQLIACLESHTPQQFKKWLDRIIKPVTRQELTALWDRNSSSTIEQQITLSSDNTINISRSFQIPVAKEDWKSVPLSIIDLTQQKLLEQKLLRDSKLEAITLLAGGIAHEFNNINSALFGNLELAKYHLSNNGNAQKYIESASKALEVTKGLSNQLLTFAQGGDPRFEHVKIQETLKDAVHFATTGSDIIPTFEIDDELLPIYADKSQIFQVIVNLIINAKQAIVAEGNIHLKAYNIQRQFAGGTVTDVMIDVIDNGKGIETKDIPTVFEPYFTRNTAGSGLGLAIVQSIINKHDGEVTIESTRGVGTQVIIRLPSASSPDKHHTPVQVGSAGSRRALIIDDEPMVLDTITDMLLTLGYDTTKASSGKQGLQSFMDAVTKSQPFDVVLIDLTLANEESGEVFAQKILDIAPSTPLIASSGYANNSLLTDYKAYGFSGRLVKPFTMHELEVAIDQLLN